MTTRRRYQPPLGARMWKCPKWRQPFQITHLFICSQRNHNKYSCYYYKILKKKKNHQSKKHWLLSSYFVPKWMQQAGLALWWVCGCSSVHESAGMYAKQGPSDTARITDLQQDLHLVLTAAAGAQGQLIIFIWWHVRQGPNPGFTHCSCWWNRH